MDDLSARIPALKKTAIWVGCSKAFPIIVGYVPIGFAFGVLARKVGISALNTVLMSIVVFAGSSQFIAIGLVLAGATAITIVITTFVVNLRHMLMSAALSPYLKNWKPLSLITFSYQLTDETFAIHADRFSEQDLDKTATYTINIIAQISWVSGTILGIVASDFISDVKPFALDYALTAMFIGLLVFQLKTKSHYFVAMISGALSVFLLLLGMKQWNVMLATLISATLGLQIEKWIKTKSS
jgi:4-azaleucine resistance transporter AzlC